jgi:hypothetical protein
MHLSIVLQARIARGCEYIVHFYPNISKTNKFSIW